MVASSVHQSNYKSTGCKYVFVVLLLLDAHISCCTAELLLSTLALAYQQYGKNAVLRPNRVLLAHAMLSDIATICKHGLTSTC